MKHQTIIFNATEALNPQRRGIGVQMRTWLEKAPFTDYPHLQFVLASRSIPNQDALEISAANVQQIIQETPSEETFIDYMYSMGGDLLFFPLAQQRYIRKSSAKVVGVDYGMEDLYCRNYIAPRSLSDTMQWHEFAMQHYTNIITVSKASQRDLEWFFPEYRDKVEVIYPGSISTALVADEALPEVLKDARYILIIGYEHKKNIIRISDAFDTFKHKTGSKTKLVLAGKSGFGGEEIDSHIANLASANDIIRLGYISDVVKQTLLRHCHAVVALPIYEGFGISALEGLEAGKIVLVSDNGSLKEVVGKAGYTANPFSVASIIKQLTIIDGLSDNPKKAYIADRLVVFDQAIQAKNLLQYLSRVVS